jgi:hypothetical protein
VYHGLLLQQFLREEEQFREKERVMVEEGLRMMEVRRLQQEKLHGRWLEEEHRRQRQRSAYRIQRWYKKKQSLEDPRPMPTAAPSDAPTPSMEPRVMEGKPAVPDDNVLATPPSAKKKKKTIRVAFDASVRDSPSTLLSPSIFDITFTPQARQEK